jgi:hypothetical protein
LDFSVEGQGPDSVWNIEPSGYLRHDYHDPKQKERKHGENGQDNFCCQSKARHRDAPNVANDISLEFVIMGEWAILNTPSTTGRACIA